MVRVVIGSHLWLRNLLMVAVIQHYLINLLNPDSQHGQPPFFLGKFYQGAELTPAGSVLIGQPKRIWRADIQGEAHRAVLLLLSHHVLPTHHDISFSLFLFGFDLLPEPFLVQQPTNRKGRVLLHFVFFEHDLLLRTQTQRRFILF